ncbi:hypothetical protein [Flexivirga alba]|uniref:Uncharacterized protein n=1 Tax=Flexivirga alba TaxID=702742 RepID=A0ABW2AHF4_9MICO
MNTNLPNADVAAAIRQYGASVRTSLHGDETSAVSYAGLWLLLASLAPVVTDGAAFRNVLGLTPSEAKSAATQLLDEPHPTVATALGAWLRQDVVLSGDLPVVVTKLPTKEALDEWAQRETRGVVRTFPLDIDQDTMLILASALVLTPRWSARVSRDDDDDMLVLAGGCRLWSTRRSGW